MNPSLTFLFSIPLLSATALAQNNLVVNPEEDAFKRAESMYQAATKSKSNADQKLLFRNAIRQLQLYIAKFPEHKNTEAATYYLGSSYFQLGKMTPARKVFTDVITKYKKGKFVAQAANYLAYDAEFNKKYHLAANFYGIVAKNSDKAIFKEKGLFRQGLCYQTLKQESKAVKIYDSLIAVSKLKSTYHQQAQLRVGHIYTNQGKFELAKNHFSAIAKENVNPKIRAEATFFKGICFAQIRDFKNAEIAYTEVLKLPGVKWKPQAQVAIMEMRYSAGDFKGVIKTQLTSGMPEDKSLQGRRLILTGQSHLKLREYSKAIEAFSAAERKMPNTMEAFEANYRRILCYYNLKSNLVTDQVNQFINRYGRQFSQHTYMHTCLMLQAETLFDSKDFIHALKAYEQINPKLIAQSHQPSLIYKKAWCYSETKQFRKAIDQFTQFLTLYPSDPRKAQILNIRAKSYQSIGNTKSALKDFDTVIKLAPKTYLAALALQSSARILKDQEKYKPMVERYEKLLDSSEDLDPVSIVNAHYWAAWGHYKNEQYKLAVPHLDKANSLDKGAYKKQLSLLSVLCHFNLKQKKECVTAAKAANMAGIANDIPMGVYRWIGIQCYKSAEFADAQLFLSLGVTKLQPSDTPVYYWRLLAKCQYQNKHYKWALQSLTHALNLETDESQIVNLLLYKALCQSGENRPEQAKATAIMALKKNPTGKTKALLLKLLGDLHFKSQNYKDAAISFAAITEFYEDKEILPYSISMIVKTLEASNKASQADIYKKRLAKDFPDYKLPK